MDLAQFDLIEAAERGVDVDIINPMTDELLEDDDGKVVSIKILGKDARKWQQTAKKIQARNANKYRGKDVPPSQLEKDLIEIAAECTISWSNIDFNDSKLPCNTSNALMLYQKRSWIAEQVLAKASDRANYKEK